MKALVFENKVIQLEDTEFEVAPTLLWMDAPTNCTVGWLLQDGVLIEPPQYIATNRDRIQDLEIQITPRNLRSAILGDQYAIDQIASIENQIASLRDAE